MSKGYNRKNLLQRKIEVQNITLEHTKMGVTQEWLFENVFSKLPWKMSRATYYNYLGENAKANLKKIEQVDKMQQSLF